MAEFFLSLLMLLASRFGKREREHVKVTDRTDKSEFYNAKLRDTK